jgi:ADP-ribose pyrophosphatase YjhB (NUDIX family)
VILDLISKAWKLLPRQGRTFVARRLEPKFTASVTGIITNERGEVLLLDHLLRPKSGWGPPGGFVEKGEQAETALRREIKEETGLDVRNIHLVRIRTFKRHLEIVFTAEAIGDAVVGSREIRSLEWFDPDKMPEDMGLHLHFQIKNALAAKQDDPETPKLV